MTGPHPAVPDADAAAVAAALARLVSGTADSAAVDSSPPPVTGPTERTPAQVVDEAESALERLSTASSFVVRDGEQRLRRAVDAAGGENQELAERGRAVLGTLEEFRAAAGTTAPSADAPTESLTRDDHVHRGRTTLLKGDGVPTDR